MAEIKLWFLMVGFTVTPWILYAAALGLGLSAIWDRGKKARVMIAMTCLFLGTVILIVLVLPFNWSALYTFPEL